MTNTPHSWDRRADESDHAFEACAAYLDTGSLRDAYRQQTGKEGAKQAPGRWTGWSTKHNWVSRRAAYIEFTIRECQEAIQLELVQIRKRFIDVANGLLNDKPDLPSIRAASQLIHEQELLNAGNQLVAYLEPAAPAAISPVSLNGLIMNPALS